jgi:hypothetical protein
VGVKWHRNVQIAPGDFLDERGDAVVTKGLIANIKVKTIYLTDGNGGVAAKGINGIPASLWGDIESASKGSSQSSSHA